MQKPMIEITSVLAAAEAGLPRFEQAVQPIDYEWKGVLFSEMLFLLACCSILGANRMVESGRGRGQSTHILAAVFPDIPITSIEMDEHSPDRAIAEQRLRPFANLKLLYGDATRLLPEVVQRGDAVLIDGPKHFRAVRLAVRLLRQRQPAALFLHDVSRGAPERGFLEKALPGAIFSDEPRFVERFKHLDDRCWAKTNPVKSAEWKPYMFGDGTRSSYGPTFACIPGFLPVRSPMLSLSLAFAGWKSKLGSKRKAD